DGEAPREALLELARSSSGYGRAQALDLLAQRRPDDPEVKAMLVETLANGRRDEIGQVAYTLARSGSPEARDALIAAMKSGDRNVATYAAGAVGDMLADPDMAAAMRELAAGADDPQLRQTALGRLIQSGLPEGTELAARAIRSGDKEAARTALQSLTYANTAAARALAVEAARQSEPEVRGAAASALAQSADPSAATALIELSRDRDPSVRAQALSGLGQVGSEEAITTLVTAARSGSAEDRQPAIQALAYSDDARASGVLAELIRSSDPQTATTAIYASYSGGRDVDRALVAALSSTDQQIRQAAASQLRSRGSRLDGSARKKVDDILGPDTTYASARYFE
ncbi:MAG TPA: HEAT repeat domain-containing protein, partial [Kofleriaceae bacterium]|nr:HEAT repeat domain-containing protein [Kofleriaceae bacterium]